MNFAQNYDSDDDEATRLPANLFETATCFRDVLKVNMQHLRGKDDIQPLEAYGDEIPLWRKLVAMNEDGFYTLSGHRAVEEYGKQTCHWVSGNCLYVSTEEKSHVTGIMTAAMATSLETFLDPEKFPVYLSLHWISSEPFSPILDTFPPSYVLKREKQSSDRDALDSLPWTDVEVRQPKTSMREIGLDALLETNPCLSQLFREKDQYVYVEIACHDLRAGCVENMLLEFLQEEKLPSLLPLITNASSLQDLLDINIRYWSGKGKDMPFLWGPVDISLKPYTQTLVDLHRHGCFVVEAEPPVAAEASLERRYRTYNGDVLYFPHEQRSWMECVVPKGLAPSLLNYLKAQTSIYFEMYNMQPFEVLADTFPSMEFDLYRGEEGGCVDKNDCTPQESWTVGESRVSIYEEGDLRVEVLRDAFPRAYALLKEHVHVKIVSKKFGEGPFVGDILLGFFQRSSCTIS